MFQWRKFDFFSEKMVTEEGSNEPHPALARPDYNITCTASGRNQLLVGDATGGVTIFDRNFNIVMWFEAHAIKVTHMRRLKTRNILITVGEDSGDTLLPVLKVWNLDKINKHGYPERARSKDLVPDRSMASPVTTVECLEDLKQVAVGLASGYVIIVYGNDISRDRFTHTRTLPPLDPSLPEPVTGLGWRTVGSSDAQQALLFVATLERVIVYNTAQRDRTSVLDDIGCEMGASVMSDNDDFIIGKREAVYFYEPDGRGACFIFEGHKKRIFWFRSYLCVVFREENDDDRLLIYDLNHKLRAYEHKFEDVTDIVSEWGSIFLLTRSGVVHQLEELDTNTKLDLLYKKKAYPVAISLAKNEDTISASDIYRRYGDHLYDDKGDYERAIEQYIHTIGRLEPSYVIRKFLDSQRIHNLTKYLQELHSKRKATREHTTLLLNCYTKLKDLQNLDAFIKTGDAEVTFDVQTAIKVLRQARYYDHALYLAQEYNEHDDFLKIQLEDIGAQNAAGYEEALSYIETLDFDAAEQNVKKYGKSLMTNLPDATTALIINLCTVGDGGALDGPSDRDRLETHDDFGAIPTAPISMPAMMARSNYNSAPTAGYDDDDVPEDLSALLGGPVMAPEAPADASMRSALFSRTKALVGDVRSSLHLGGGQSTSTAPPPPASYGGQASGGASDSLFSALPGGGAVRGSAGGAVKMSRPTRRARLSKPNEFIHIFVDHPDLLVHFLEVVVEQRGDDASLSSVVHNTLLELYLTAEEEERFQAAHGAGAASVGPGGAAISRAKNTERMEKALKLLQNQNVAGDMAQALILCKLYNFREGMLYVYEKLMQFDEIVQVYMEENDYENILQSCRDYGAQLPDLWIRVLSYFAGRDDTRTEIAEVLKNIDDNNLLPPLRVIQILSANPSATLNTVKDYIQRRLQTENALIADDQAKIDHYLVETTKMREEIHELRTSAKMFQTHKCTMCNSPLDLPAVHFLCMHSFHQRCLGDSENECPVCEPDNRQVISVRQNWDKNLHNHEPFFHQLETAQDGFSVASEYFGKCIFSKISLLDDDEVAARNYDANLTDRERLFQ